MPAGASVPGSAPTPCPWTVQSPVAPESVSPSDGDSGICKDIEFVMLGSGGSKRTNDSISLNQKAHVEAFFVFAECIGDEPICLQGANEPAAVAGCSAALELKVKHQLQGSANLVCKNGLPISDPDFDLSAQQQAWLAGAFPGIERKFQIVFKDRNAEETVGDDLAFMIRNLAVDALDDIVGTYLADDELPGCPDKAASPGAAGDPAGNPSTSPTAQAERPSPKTAQAA
jgi:hypothetical protein